MTFKNAVMEKRYESYDEYRDKSPFFDEELNAHVFLKYDDVVHFLKYANGLSNRKKQQFDGISACPFSKPLVSFYSEWLMYMDGDEHSEARKVVHSALTQTNKSLRHVVENSWQQIVVSTDILKSGAINVIESITEPFTLSVLADVLGISTEDYAEILQKAMPVVAFLGSGDIGSEQARKTVVDSINETSALINHLLDEKRYRESSVIGNLVEQVTSRQLVLPLIINVVIDGYEPLLSMLNNLLFIAIKEHRQRPELFNSSNNNSIIDEIIRLECPFQYCARVAPTDLNINDYRIVKGQKVMCFISAANRDPEVFESPAMFLHRQNSNKNLSFGVGAHYCVGVNIAKKTTSLFWDYFQPYLETLNISVLNHQWNDDFGYKLLNELEISIADKDAV